MVGVMVPQPIAEYLSLYALYGNKTKSSLIRTIINSGYNQILEQKPVTHLIRDIIAKYQLEWNYLINIQSHTLFSDFIEDKRKKLKYAGVSDALVNKIIKRIKE